MDGVLIDHTERKICFARDEGIELSPEETASSRMRKLVPRGAYLRIQERLYNDPRSAFDAPLHEGVLEMLDALSGAEIPFVLISRRKIPQNALVLLEGHGLWMKYFNYKNSYFVDRIVDKDIHASRLEVTHYIDDEVEVLDALTSVEHKLLFDTVDAFAELDTYPRASSWQEATRFLFDDK